MTPEQVAIFIEERKWDYRGELRAVASWRAAEPDLARSVRLRRGACGAYPNRRPPLLHLQPHWCSHVGPWYVLELFLIHGVGVLTRRPQISRKDNTTSRQ